MSGIYSRFLSELARQKAPCVLEIGTLRWGAAPGGHKADVLRANPKALYAGADVTAGPDVDVVADAHRLAEVVTPGSLDALLCLATLEHLARPWVVVEQFRQVLRPGGACCVQTHQTFPYHPYPEDYWRFSTAALRVLFEGWEVLGCEHEHPARVVPARNVFPHAKDWNFEGEAWLNVAILARRT